MSCEHVKALEKDIESLQEFHRTAKAVGNHRMAAAFKRCIAEFEKLRDNHECRKEVA